MVSSRAHGPAGRSTLLAAAGPPVVSSPRPIRALGIDAVRAIRDDIRSRVEILLGQLTDCSA
jgi:hypothetical protein